MAPDLYVIRHCESSGPQPDAPLTQAGFTQSRDLAEQLANLGIRRIVSSPYLRALQSIEPLAMTIGLAVEQEPRLASGSDLSPSSCSRRASSSSPRS